MSRVRWRFHLIDPALGLSPESRARIFAQAITARQTQRRMFKAAIVMAIPMALAAVLVPGLLAGSSPERILLWSFLVLAPAFAVYVLLWVRWALRPALRDALRAHGAATDTTTDAPAPLRAAADPASGAPGHATIACVRCGSAIHVPSGAPAPTCPECGADQRQMDDASRRWWFVFRQVDPVIRMLPDRARAEFRQAALDRGLGPFLIALLLVVTAGAGLVLVWTWRDMSAGWFVGEMLDGLTGALLLAGVMLGYVVLAGLVHLTLGRASRREVRAMGYEVCRRCGVLLAGTAAQVADCPECGTTRRPLPERAQPPAGCPPVGALAEVRNLMQELQWQAGTRCQPEHVALLVTPPVAFAGGVIVFGLDLSGLAIGLGAALAIVVALVARLWSVGMRRTRRLVCARLRDAGLAVCVACGRWLDDPADAGAPCPDCGAAAADCGTDAIEAGTNDAGPGDSEANVAA